MEAALKQSGFKCFRTRHGLEVDFIIHLRNEIWAIEVKARDAINQDLVGLNALAEYLPNIQHRVLVTPKDKKRRKNEILISDYLTLLKEMKF